MSELSDLLKSKNILTEFYLHDISKEVKFDESVKIAALCTGISAYLPEPMNLFLKGESGIGKTYNVMKALSYLPQHNIRHLGGLSPKALVHDHGILMNKDGKEINPDDKPEKPIRKTFKTDEEFAEANKEYKDKLKKWNAELSTSYTLIDLKNVTLFFLETPDQGAFDTLLPILSHDTDRVEYKFTDKTAKGKLRTSKVVIEGFPATIFLTVDKKIERMEELATRSLSASPEHSVEKIKAANQVTNGKNCKPWQKYSESKEKELLKKLFSSVCETFENGDYEIVIPFENLTELYPCEITRDMRDFTHFSQLIKTITALHIHQRAAIEVKRRKYIVSSISDVEFAFKTFGSIFETTRTSSDKALLDFYWEDFKPFADWLSEQEGEENLLLSCTIRNLVDHYNSKHPKDKKVYNTIAQYLEKLNKKGYVDKRRDATDKRKWLYFPVVEKKDELVYNPLNHGDKGDLASFLRDGYEAWKKNVLLKSTWYVVDKSEKPSKDEREEEVSFKFKEVSEEEARKKIFN